MPVMVAQVARPALSEQRGATVRSGRRLALAAVDQGQLLVTPVETVEIMVVVVVVVR